MPGSGSPSLWRLERVPAAAAAAVVALLLLAWWPQFASAGNCDLTRVTFTSGPQNLCISPSTVTTGAAVGAAYGATYPVTFAWIVDEGASTPQGPYTLTATSAVSGSNRFMSCSAATTGERGVCVHAVACLMHPRQRALPLPLPALRPCRARSASDSWRHSGRGGWHVCHHERGELQLHFNTDRQQQPKPPDCDGQGRLQRQHNCQQHKDMDFDTGGLAYLAVHTAVGQQ